MKRSLKRWVVPVLLFAAVFVVEFLLRRYTFLQKEYFGLFLNTPDYLQEVHNGPRPFLTLAGDFLSQFYRAAWVGPVLTALFFTLCFLLLRLLWRRSTRKDLLDLTACAVAVIALLVVNLLPDRRENERWAKVEYATLHQQWNKVISAATPKAAQKDRVFIPYALLAHSERGTLPQNIFRYPIQGPEDIHTEGERTRHGYFLAAMTDECMGCTNEAIHHTFQTACTTPHGTSHGTLRQLIKLNIASGNKVMARKYCDILEKSPLNAATARAARRYAETLPEQSYLDHGASDTAAIVSQNISRNMRLLATAGYFNNAAADRYRCLLLLQRDLRNFAASFAPEEDIAALPLVYQQAFCMIADDDIQSRISPAVKEAFTQYMEAYNQIRAKDDDPIQPGTFWEYYFLGY